MCVFPNMKCGGMKICFVHKKSHLLISHIFFFLPLISFPNFLTFLLLFFKLPKLSQVIFPLPMAMYDLSFILYVFN